jgi:excinuclease ABC subunit A
MQFLSDVFIRCPDCNGRRYRPHILEVKIRQETEDRRQKTEDRRPETGGRAQEPNTAASRPTPHASRITHHASRSFSIADLLESTVEEAIAFLSGFPESRPAARAVESLKLLEEVGLGYLRLGQPINTLSGGESQRLKLVRHLAEVIVAADGSRRTSKPQIQTPQPESSKSLRTPEPWKLGEPADDPSPALKGTLSPCKGEREGERRLTSIPWSTPIQACGSGVLSLLTPTPTLFLFDEPTTGLHFDDVRVLLKVFQRLVDAGHSVLVIEHNVEVMKSADWIIDLGPDAGDQGGRVVAAGTPEQIAACPESHTGRALRAVLSLPTAPA